MTKTGALRHKAGTLGNPAFFMRNIDIFILKCYNNNVDN